MQQSAPHQHVGQKLVRQSGSIAAPLSGASQLSVLTFNVLADGLAQDGGFIRAPQEALQWDHRKALLLAEITAADADIVCLQECNHFEDCFEPELARLGYAGHFVAKLHSPAQQYGHSADGCALFYRTARLAAVSPPQKANFTCANGEAAAQGVLRWRLHDKLAEQQLLVATLHLKAKGGATNDAIRHSQAQQAVGLLAADAAGAATPGPSSNGSLPEASVSMQVPSDSNSNSSGLSAGDLAAQDTARHSSGNGSHPPEGAAAGRMPVLLCGDMNAEPHSSACQALRGHTLGLRSLWDARLEVPALEEALLTTWKFRAEGESRRIIDYIWYTAELQPVARWLTPSAADIGVDALPSMAYPSDHLACLATLQWT